MVTGLEVFGRGGRFYLFTVRSRPDPAPH